MTKLTVLATVLAAYRLAWAHLGYLWLRSMPWAFISLASFFVGTYMMDGAIMRGWAYQLPTAGAGLLVLIGGCVAALYLGVVVAIAAHRVYLPDYGGDGDDPAPESPGRRSRLRSIMLSSIGTLCWLAATRSVFVTWSVKILSNAAITVAVLLAAYAALARFAPWLSAAAFTDATMTPARSFHLTSGSGWRIWLALVATMLPAGFAQVVVQNIFAANLRGASFGLAGVFIQFIVIWLGAVACAALAAGVLSQVYVALRGDPAGVTPVPASS